MKHLIFIFQNVTILRRNAVSFEFDILTDCFFINSVFLECKLVSLEHSLLKVLGYGKILTYIVLCMLLKKARLPHSHNQCLPLGKTTVLCVFPMMMLLCINKSTKPARCHLIYSHSEPDFPGLNLIIFS